MNGAKHREQVHERSEVGTSPNPALEEGHLNQLTAYMKQPNPEPPEGGDGWFPNGFLHAELINEKPAPRANFRFKNYGDIMNMNLMDIMKMNCMDIMKQTSLQNRLQHHL